MPLAGGILQNGYQGGRVWGAALAAGARAYSLFGPTPKAEAAAIGAADRLVKSFRVRNRKTDCLDLIAADMSPQGMYLISDDMPNVGECVLCSFSLRTEDPEYYLFGRVRRVNWHRRATDRLRPGFGVQFLDVPPQELISMHKALKGLPPPLPSQRRQTPPSPPIPAPRPDPYGTFVSRWYRNETGKRLYIRA